MYLLVERHLIYLQVVACCMSHIVLVTISFWPFQLCKRQQQRGMGFHRFCHQIHILVFLSSCTFLNNLIVKKQMKRVTILLRTGGPHPYPRPPQTICHAIEWKLLHFVFLVADKRLYKRLCPSVGLLVMVIESKSGKPRISAPVHPSATGIGRVPGLV